MTMSRWSMLLGGMTLLACVPPGDDDSPSPTPVDTPEETAPATATQPTSPTPAGTPTAEPTDPPNATDPPNVTDPPEVTDPPAVTDPPEMTEPPTDIPVDTEPPPPEDTPAPLVDCTQMTRTFWAWDLSVMPPASIQVPATCVFTGPNAYLYVADDQLGTFVDAEMARDFMDVMEDDAGPGAIYPNEGIIENDQAAFGEFPDVLDNDPRIYLFLLDIADFTNSEGETYSFDGYFNAYDQLPNQQVETVTRGEYHSNEVEMLYINSRIRPVTDPYTLAVAAHEMQHLIHYNYDTSEEIWLSEALAEIAMLVNGYYTDEPWVESYSRHPETPLVNNTSSGSYGSYLLWGMYLYEQLGEEFMIPLESQSGDGITGLNRALSAEGYDTTFDQLYADWLVANIVQEPALDQGQFGYHFTETLPEMKRVATLEQGDSYDGEIIAFAVDYVDIDASQSVVANVSFPAGSKALVELVSRSSRGTTVNTVPVDRQGVAHLQLTASASWTVVISNIDTSQIDTGETLSYSLAFASP